MVRTIYDECYDMLDRLLFEINENKGNKIEVITEELINFLTTDDNDYEEIFQTIDFKDYLSNKQKYKKIMMLIVISKAYYIAIYSLKNDIDSEYYENIIDDLEQLDTNSIINLFFNKHDNSKLIDYVDDFCDYFEKNYIYRNNSMEEIIRQDKLSILLKINPFEIFNFINYKNPKELLKTEKIIQSFIDIYDSALSYTFIDEHGESSFYDSNDDFLIEVFKEKISDKYGNKKALKEFYSYIFSNVYEGIVVFYSIDCLLMKKYECLVKEFINSEISFEKVYQKIMDDNVFFLNLIDFFLEINDGIYDGELMVKRTEFKEKGNIKLLKELNPYYEEEELSFQKIKKRYSN